METFSRSAILLENIETLSKKHVAIFGLGGVGSFVTEVLARTGIGNLTLVDHDTVSVSNINRQIYALNSTIGKYKVDIAKERVLDINPKCNVNIFKTFVLRNTIDSFDFSKFDYIVDAIDTVTAKLLLIENAKEHNIPVISSMGTGNKLDPTKFQITDINKTSICPLAKVMRYELRKRNIKNVKVLFSTEVPINITNNPIEQKILNNESSNKHQIPGSVAFVPSVAGIMIAREVILDLINKKSTS